MICTLVGFMFVINQKKSALQRYPYASRGIKRHGVTGQSDLKLYYDLNLSILEMFCSSHLFGCYCHPEYVCHLV